jgi:hypothetical protein
VPKLQGCFFNERGKRVSENSKRKGRILIENFNGIRHADLEIGPCMVITTPKDQAMLTAARLVCLYGLSGEALKTGFAEKSALSVKAAATLKLESRFHSIFEEGAVLHKNTEVTFMMSEDIWFRLVQGDEGTPAFSFSETLERAMEENNGGLLDQIRSGEPACFVPGTRAVIPTLSQDEFDHLSFRFDYLTGAFGEVVTRYRPVMQAVAPSPRMQELADTLLQGRYIFEDGRDTLVSEDGRHRPFSILSMGQKEALWPVNLMLAGKEGFLIVEEPEGHLSPGECALMGELIRAYVENGGQITLTTKSPELVLHLPEDRICPVFD